MHYEKPVLTLKEFAAECGLHVTTVQRNIITKGKVRYSRSGPKGHLRFSREDADFYHSKHTFGGTAYK